MTEVKLSVAAACAAMKGLRSGELLQALRVFWPEGLRDPLLRSFVFTGADGLKRFTSHHSVAIYRLIKQDGKTLPEALTEITGLDGLEVQFMSLA